MSDKLTKATQEALERQLDSGLTLNNLDIVYKLAKINHIAKEDKEMNGNYGARRPGYDTYGNYGEYGNYGRGNYGARGRDMRYRGDDYMDRIYNEYGRYMESRDRYGAGEESDKAFHFMAKALGEYLDFLYEEADTPQKKQMLNETLQRSMR